MYLYGTYWINKIIKLKVQFTNISDSVKKKKILHHIVQPNCDIYIGIVKVACGKRGKVLIARYSRTVKTTIRLTILFVFFFFTIQRVIAKLAQKYSRYNACQCSVTRI